jgi:heme-degrading monooxygenase HmoA
MFTRIVTINLKPNSAISFKETIEKQVIPMLRKQKGFQELSTFVSPTGTEAIGISIWDTKENAESYNREGYPEVLKSLTTILNGTPQIKTYELANSTYHKISAFAAN